MLPGSLRYNEDCPAGLRRSGRSPVGEGLLPHSDNEKPQRERQLFEEDGEKNLVHEGQAFHDPVIRAVFLSEFMASPSWRILFPLYTRPEERGLEGPEMSGLIPDGHEMRAFLTSPYLYYKL